MDVAEFLVIPYLLLFLGLGSAAIHYLSFRKRRAKLLIKSEFKGQKQYK